MKQAIIKAYDVALSHRAFILSIAILGFATTQSKRSMIEFGIAMIGGSLMQASLKTYSSRNVRLRPPVNAEFLFYLFYDARNCDALVGDLEERYKLINRKFGAHRANFWYWTQVLRSLAPLGWAATKRFLKAASGVAALVEMWRRIRS